MAGRGNPGHRAGGTAFSGRWPDGRPGSRAGRSRGLAEQPGVLAVVDAAELFRLDGRVALITGGAGLLGRRHCEALLGAGGQIVVGDVDGPRAEALADELGAHRALGLGLDVADERSVQACVDAAVARFGRLDILVNNAALT